MHGLGARVAPKNRAKSRPRSIPPVSDDQQRADDRWQGMKRERIFQQLQRWGHGRCEECSFDIVPPEEPDDLALVVDYIAARLDADHIEPRGEGGPDEPWNLRLLCGYRARGENACHVERHGRPEWTAAS
jgi:hypothetical protein